MKNYEEAVNELADYYNNKYLQYAFQPNVKQCHSEQQYEALIAKLQHSIEKGLSSSIHRPGAGQDSFFFLVSVMEQYQNEHDCSCFFYETALSTLKEYIRKNKSEGFDTTEMERAAAHLSGQANDYGGTASYIPMEKEFYASANFKDLVESRHSIRHFSSMPVLLEDIKEAIRIAQFTPSACNRQGWKSRIVIDKEIKKSVLGNQNGNRGFGDEIDKLIVITFDLRFSNIERELYQAFIDGGMYAMSVLYALHYIGIAAIPLSASLHIDQEKRVRKLIGMDDAEVLILFIGVGNYADECNITKSKRKRPFIEVI